MRRIVFLFSACLCLAISSRAQPALPSIGGGFSSAHHTQAKLVLSADTAKPGDTILAGVDLKMDPDWHTYWKNPGDAGMATEIKWQLPPGITNGEIEWPLPQKFPPIEVTTYGYTNEVMLLVPLTLASNLPAGPVDLKANVSWLECKDVCIPANQDVEATLNVGLETKKSDGDALIQSWQNKVPQDASTIFYSTPITSWWEKPSEGDTRPLMIDVKASGLIDFFPATNDAYAIEPKTEIVSENSNSAKPEVVLHKLVKKYQGDWPKETSGVLVFQKNGETVGYDATFFIGTQTTVLTSPSFVQMLLYAFIGGLILNVMPCVLPVIALKILGFVSEARSSPRRVRALGGIYAVGVLFSFLVMAAIVIGVEAAGHQAGWGMQFGSPVFIVCLTTLVTLVALNLFGVFEVTLGGRTLDAAGNLASKHGASGAFFNGVLATTLATPCTAPFLAPALGFAFSQPPATIVSIFLTVGLGLASPYVLLICNPAWLKFLPKPGAWMEKFKIAMGFPMLATVMWLLHVAASDYGRGVFWLGIFLVIVAFAAWIFGEFVQRGRKRKGIALAIVLVLLAGSYAYALENKLHWREMIAETDTTSLAEPSGGIDWQPWSPEAVAQARAAGKPVLVDFTASWCVTCNAIVKPALENASVSAKLKEMNAVALLADYTRTPPLITDEISKFGGAGVPLVLVYPKNPDAAPIVLPQPSPLQLPSGYSQTILNALDRAAH